MTATEFRPPILPKPKTLGELVTRFDAHLPAGLVSFDRHGNLVVKFVVKPEQKYQAMRLEDAAGWMLHVEVYRPEVDDEAELKALLGLEETNE